MRRDRETLIIAALAFALVALVGAYTVACARQEQHWTEDILRPAPGVCTDTVIYYRTGGGR